MGCIETYTMGLQFVGLATLNSNMGCIETLLVHRVMQTFSLLNSNMGCIETVQKHSSRVLECEVEQ